MIAVLLGVAIAACSAPNHVQAPPRLTGVQTAEVRTSDVADVYETTGTVRSQTTSNLSAKVIGNVTRVLAGEGERVRRGQLLIQIDSREATSMLQKARAGSDSTDRGMDAAVAAENAAAAQAALADSTYKRFLVLRDRGSVSAHEFDQVEAQQKAAAADLQRARAMRRQVVSQSAAARADVTTASTFAGYSEIRSPIDGVVTAKHVDAGSQAAPGMVLMTVEDPASLVVDAFVPDDVAVRLHAGDIAEIDPGSSTIQRARVTQVVPALDPATRTALVKLELVGSSPPSPPESRRSGDERSAAPSFRPGQAARVRLAVGTRRSMVVPDSAIARRGQLRSVYVVGNDGLLTLRLVTTGRSFGGATEVLSGLEDGERFVISATPAMHDGVQIAESRSEGRP